MKWNDGFVLQDLKPFEINMKFKTLKDILNGRIGFGNLDGKERNLDGVVLTHTFTLANIEESLQHSLGSFPLGYVVLRTSNGGVIYDGTSRTTKENIWLRSTTANNAVTIFIAR